MPPAIEIKQRRNQRDQSIANGEHGVGSRRFRQFDALLQSADQQSGHNVDCGDQNRCQRVALAEARRAVHGSVEFGFLGNRLPPPPGLGLVDQPGIHVGVDGHLLARATRRE